MSRTPAVFTAVAAAALLTLLAGGCARSRVVTISAVPPDATIRVEGRDRGRGPLTETFTFSGDTDVYRVTAEREGYRSQSKVITPDERRESLVIELKPTPRPVTFSVSPMPAVVKIDGKPLSDTPQSEVTTDVEFRIEPGGRWTTHTVTAEREGFDTVTQELRYEDQRTLYTLKLGAKHKDLIISTVPDKAEVYINEEFFGTSPVDRKGVAFPVDRQTGEFEPQRVRIKKPGYGEVTTEISWDDGRINYSYELAPQAKDVRIVTNPPDATVTLGGFELKRDESGAYVYKGLVFEPINEKGESRPYAGMAEKKKTADSEWERKPFEIAWHGGQTEYKVDLKEILVRSVPLTRVRMVRGEDGTWSAKAETSTTVGFKQVTDGPEANEATRVTRLPKGTKIDTLAVSPDGSQLLYTTLSGTAGELRSQIFRLSTEGSADPAPLTDGRSLEITPSYTPDGSRVVFASNRGGRKLSIWSMPAVGQPVPEQLTTGDGIDLWPSVDSNPKPRLFFQSFVDTRPDPRLFSTQLGVVMKKDLTAGGGAAAGGTQPRVAPTADVVVFAAQDEKTGKRDIYRMSDGGLDVINLTNTPDVDEFDPTWSSDGLRVAYVSDANRSGEAPDNHDIWFRDASGTGEAVRVTTNGSWDDCPAWDPRDPAIYFRSNRGGEWNIWRIALK